MAFQTVFKRYELKYLLTERQKEKVLLAMEPYMRWISMEEPLSAISILIRATTGWSAALLKAPPIRKSSASAAMVGQSRRAPYLWS